MAFEADRLTRIKLCILFLLDNVHIPLSDEQIILGLEPYDWIDRFSMAQALEELAQQDMLNSENYEGRIRYTLTESGKNTLELFVHEIPISIRSEIDECSQSIRRRAKSESEYITDYRKIAEGRYETDLKIMEGSRPLLSIRLELPTISQAHTLCESWPQIAPDIYSSLMRPALEKTK